MIDAGTPQSEALKVYAEVTDTLSVPYTTGIQRVVREVLSRLGSADYPDLELIPVFKAAPNAPYRRLTAGERALLDSHPAGGKAGRRADRFGRLAPIVRLVGDRRAIYRFRIGFRHARASARERMARRDRLALDAMEPGSVFLDIEGSWFDPEPRASLLPGLVNSGITVAVIIHDVMPTKFPEWFHPRQVGVFNDWIRAHIEWSSCFLTNSECTARDLVEIASRQGRDITDSVAPIQLGADFSVEDSTPVQLPSSVGRYLLVVGTLEPRKNHRLALDAFDRLRPRFDDLSLVIVGKEGWMVEDLVERIRSHSEFGRRLLWLGGLDDSELRWLYENAFMAVAPSRYEGLGVPVIEALKYGCPTVASTGGALPEAGKGHTELVDPDDLDGLIAIVSEHLEDDAHHREWIDRAALYRAPSWDDTAAAVADALRSMKTPREVGG